MPSMPLTGQALDKALTDLPGWSVRDGELTASFTGARAAVPGLYAVVAAAEDQADHHARVTILFNTITFGLNTHDAGGAITAKDTAMAARIGELAAEHGLEPAG